MMRFLPPALTSLVLLLSATFVQAGAVPKFEESVRPILKAHCFECHGEGDKLKGGLDVRLKRLLVQGGKNGPSIQPGKAKDSLLIEKLQSGEMPPGKKKLMKDEIALIARWIDGGALTTRAEPEKLAAGFQLSEDEKQYWFFQPIRQPTAPKVQQTERVRTPIDAFLLAKLEAKNLSFAADTDRRTLIRRASFDLLGLPPTPQEVDAFVKETAPDAYEKLLDRLLASPHYGERWGRHWLDVAGYADSEGYTGDDSVRLTAFRYRDYVIRAFNADMPFDQFIHEQLAGDEMIRPYPSGPPLDRIKLSSWSPADLDRLIATGFLRMAPDGTGGKDVNVKEAGNQSIADTLQIVSTSLLGLTMHCAQCHNHRYDPIPQIDYYRLRAIFEPGFIGKDWRKPIAREVASFDDEKRQKSLAIEAEAKKIDQERLTKMKVGTLDEAAKKEIASLTAKAQKLRLSKPGPDLIRAFTELPGFTPPTFFFERGDPDQPKDEVKPGQLTILAHHGLPGIPEKDAKLPTTGRRLAFARSLTAPEHPLTARVLVNRFWMHHFGKGIVTSPGDFGLLGERPTHPELLDWLATDFVAGGWKVKRFHKQLMLSTAYRQSSTASTDTRAADPDNRLLGCMPIRRLEAETVRDAMLAVSGKLNVKQFGPPVPIKPDLTGQIVIGVDTNDGAGRPTGKFVPLNGEEYRRSLYVQVRRSKPLAMLETFDAPILNPNCERRNVTTVTPQSLMLMNSKDIIEFAEFFAKRLEKEAGADTKLRVQLAWRYSWSREPSAKEIASAETFVAQQTKFYQQQKNLPKGQDASQAAWTNFCQAMLSANAFLYAE